MRLPDTLRPWHRWLSWFPPELAAELGEMLRRLHPLLGRFQAGQLHGEPEPDGLGDLHRRGPYERLLSSEWLLAAELPDEFLRRAAVGEHLFLAPRPQARQADRLIVALFDVGPWQLGAPRLVQLALWILLARRAEQAGGELLWGVWHEPGRLHRAQSQADLAAWLKRRSLVEPDAQDGQRWVAWRAAEGPAAGESWHIGAHLNLCQKEGEAPTHEVRLARSFDGRAVEVQLRSRGTRRALSVPLPASPRAGADLLKGRFQAQATLERVPEGGRLSCLHDPLVSRDGRRVAVPLLDGRGALLFHLSQRPGAVQVRPRQQLWRAGLQPLAAAFHAKTFSALLADGDKILFWQMSPGMGACRPAPGEFDAGTGSRGWMPCIRFLVQGGERLYVLDASGHLLHWAQPARAASEKGSLSPVRGPMLVDAGVVNMVHTFAEQVLYVRRQAETGELLLCSVDQSGRGERPRALGFVPAEQPVAAWFAAGPGGWQRGWRVAVRWISAPQEVWRVHCSESGRDVVEIVLAPGDRALGLVHDQAGGQDGLLVLAADGRSLSLQVRGSFELLYTSPQPIARASVCPHSALVALLTERHQLICYSVAERALRLFVDDMGRSPDATS